MGRTNIKFRQPEVEELTREQRAVYDALPMGAMQNEFLRLLPPIAVLGAKIERLIEQLTERAEITKTVYSSMATQIRRLESMREHLKTGAEPDPIVIGSLLMNTWQCGEAQVRFTARKEVREENDHAANGHEPVEAENREPVAAETRKQRRARKSQPEGEPQE